MSTYQSCAKMVPDSPRLFSHLGVEPGNGAIRYSNCLDIPIRADLGIVLMYIEVFISQVCQKPLNYM